MTFSKQFDENDILRALTYKLANPAAVAKRAGCSIFTVKRLLMELYSTGKAYREEIETPNGVTYAWKRII